MILLGPASVDPSPDRSPSFLRLPASLPPATPPPATPPAPHAGRACRNRTALHTPATTQKPLRGKALPLRHRPGLRGTSPGVPAWAQPLPVLDCHRRRVAKQRVRPGWCSRPPQGRRRERPTGPVVAGPRARGPAPGGSDSERRRSVPRAARSGAGQAIKSGRRCQATPQTTRPLSAVPRLGCAALPAFPPSNFTPLAGQRYTCYPDRAIRTVLLGPPQGAGP